MTQKPLQLIVIILLAVCVGIGLGALGVFLIGHDDTGQPGQGGPAAKAAPGGAGAADGDAGGKAPAPKGPPPAQVQLASVQQQAVQNRFKVVGRLNELRRATVAAEVSGKVVTVPVDEGDAVVGGKTVLARVEDTWVKLDLASAQAKVEAARAELDQAQRDLDYLQQLSERSAAKPKEVQDAGATVASKKAELDAAVAARDRAQEQVQRLAVIAPFDGWVVDKLTESGQWVAPGDSVAEIISRGEIEAVVNVPERLINRVEVGQSFELVVDPLNLRTEGKVTSITPTGGNLARTFPVKVRLPDAEGKLKPGMSVSAYLPTNEREQRLTVPRDAVQFQGTGAIVWVAQGEGDLQAMPVAVRVLFGAGPNFVIEPVQPEALTAKMSVVVEGMESLMPGQPIKPVGDTVAEMK